MADQVHTIATHWAVLIGINFYGAQVKGLKGAVADIHDMDQYLRARGIQQIQAFTSSATLDAKSALPVEAPPQWPTFENFAASLERIIRMSKSGDFVYVHFSGHGTQTRATSEYGRKDTGDLALVLYHQTYGVRYMRGIELAEWLEKMVAHGLIVTVVLDCCFSGSVNRNDDAALIRSVPYIHTLGYASPLDQVTKPNAYRTVQSVPTWLVDPKGYDIFAACSPHETAHEMRLGPDSTEKRGAMSNFLLRALKGSCNSDITTRSLYNHMRLKFYHFWPRQTPMHFGRAEVSFFGTLGREHNTEVINVLLKSQQLYLDAGSAHGVCKDDEYAIYPLFSADIARSHVASPLFYSHVHTVSELTSTLADNAGYRGASFPNETRWQAKRASLSAWKVPIQLGCGNHSLAQWTEAVSRKRFLSLVSDDEKSSPFIFKVSLNMQDEYEILDSSCQPIRLLPTVSWDQSESIEKVCNMLDHLSTFKYVAAIENMTPRQHFEDSFKIYLMDEAGNQYIPGEVVHLDSGEQFTLHIQNSSESPLFFEVFDMGSLWEITRVLSGGGEDFKVVAPKKQQDDRPEHTGRLEVPLLASIPKELTAINEYECEDIFKVFLTSQATSFAAFEAPALAVSAKIFGETMREEYNYHELTAFLGDFAAPFRAPDTHGKIEDWTTRTFLIKTTLSRASTPLGRN